MGWRLDSETLPGVLERVARIESDEQRQWGMLGPAALLRHLRFTFEISLGEATSPDISNWFTRSVFKWGAFSAMPWPKGKIKAPDDFTPEPDGDVDAEREQLVEVMRRFVETAEAEPNRVGVSPMFGPMSMRYWQKAHGKHVEHHLRQYNV